MSEGTVNSQIVDSVASVVTLAAGQAGAQAFAMLDAVMVETVGMLMYNAVGRQQGSSMIGAAAVTAACAKMLNAPFPILPIVFPPAPPVIEPLPPPPFPPPAPPLPPAAVIGAATVEAETAIDILKAQAATSGDDAAAAKAGLAQIAADAAPSPAAPPTPSPSPPPTPSVTAMPIEVTVVARATPYEPDRSHAPPDGQDPERAPCPPPAGEP